MMYFNTELCIVCYIKICTFAADMRPLTLEAYKVLYLLTGARVFSYYVSVFYITVLNVLVLMGLGMLLEGVFPTQIVHTMFSFPFNIPSGIILFLINLRVVPLKMVEIVGQLKTKYAKLIIYTSLAFIIFTYNILLGRLF